MGGCLHAHTGHHVGVYGRVEGLVVCILCLKFGIQTAIDLGQWWVCGLVAGWVDGHRVRPHDEQ